MGPILIFDKSALQGLRLREAVLLNTSRISMSVVGGAAAEPLRAARR